MKVLVKSGLLPGFALVAMLNFSLPAWSQQRSDQDRASGGQAQENQQQSQQREQGQEGRQGEPGQQQQRQQASEREARELDERTEAEAPQQSQRQLRVFQLEHSNPRDIQHLLSIRMDRPAPRGTAEGQVTAGYRGTAQEDLAVATAEEDGLLFVRGSEEKIKEVEQLVKALDVPQEELQKQSVGDLHVFPISSDRAQDINSILAQLGLDAQLVPMGDMHLVVASADDSEEAATNLQQVEEVMSRLGRQRSANQAEEQQKPDAPERDAADDSEQENNEA